MGWFDKLKSLFKDDKLDVAVRYELLREAVSGTMSNFHMARDRTDGKVVGLKLADKDKLDLFEARFKGQDKPCEGEIASRFKHPRIVETYGYGVTTKGLHYLVMEFLNGPGLHTLIAQRDARLRAPGTRLRLIRQMAEAIAQVHAAEFIHRDVCPRNFICSEELESLKLIDFGLALPAKEPFTQPGNRTGTPAYMAPEVIRRRRTDQRLDIFSFGVTSYQLATFELPWPGNDSPALAAVSHDSVPPRNLLEVDPTLHPQLAAAIMKCLAANPANRFQSMNDFLYAIRDVETDTVPAATPT